VLARSASLEGWPQTPSLLPSFEMPAARAPQDEVSAMTASLRRVGAMIVKEFVQLRRDRITFATMIAIPLMQLVLFGYAINTTPRNMPTAVLLQETSDVGRSILAALANTKYFKVTHQVRDAAEFDRLLQSGKVLFAIEIPANFERAVRRGEKPALLVAADATDPVATGSALSALQQIVQTALAHDRAVPDATTPAFEVRVHARYNPAGSSQLNIVPGLLGTILTLTMLIFTALSVTREIERGTMESLLAMPIRPVEIMLGKIAPYVLVGFLQASLIVGAGILLFGVPVVGNMALLAALTTLFIATNLSFGYTFSTLAQNQLPLTHFVRIVRAIMLKGSTIADLRYDALALVVLMLVAMTIAVTRFRRTLD
jgi:ABC-2 type transport system permease protein